MQGLTNAGVPGLRVYCSLDAPNTTHDNDIWIMTNEQNNKVVLGDYAAESVDDGGILVRSNIYIEQYHDKVAIPLDKSDRVMFWPGRVVVYDSDAGVELFTAFVMKNKKWIKISGDRLNILYQGEQNYIESVEATYGQVTYGENGFTWERLSNGPDKQYLNIKIKLPINLSEFGTLNASIRASDLARGNIYIYDSISGYEIANASIPPLTGITSVPVKTSVDSNEFIIRIWVQPKASSITVGSIYLK